METLPIIKLLNYILSDHFMIFVWLIPLSIVIWQAGKIKDRDVALATMIFFPLMLYFVWASTDVWQKHEVATAFNRSAQLVSAIFATIVLIRLIYCKDG